MEPSKKRRMMSLIEQDIDEFLYVMERYQFRGDWAIKEGKKCVAALEEILFHYTISNWAISILNTYLEEIDFSTRTRRCLEEMGIKQIRDLVQLSEKDICQHRGIGDKSLWEIKEFLRRYDLSLGMDITEREVQDAYYARS
jgi:DNA-directed RNA polymerase alpha subunit